MDDRPQFVCRKRFPTVVEAAVADLDDCFAGRTITRRDMVVIATRCHIHDAVALDRALATVAGYVGRSAAGTSATPSTNACGQQAGPRRNWPGCIAPWGLPSWPRLRGRSPSASGPN